MAASEQRPSSGPTGADVTGDPSGGYLDLGDEWSPGQLPSTNGPATATAHDAPTEAPGTPSWSSGTRAGSGQEEGSGEAPVPDQDRSGWAQARGFARNVQQRYDSGTSQDILVFRLDQYDQSGNRLQPIAVELRGMGLRGQISDGEEVEVRGEWRRGTLMAHQLTNVTTRAEVRAWSWRSLPGWAKALILAVPVALVVAVGLLVFLGRSGEAAAVPDVAGKDAFFAKSDVERAGFIPQQREEASETMPSGRVVRTDPPAGTEPAKGTVVTLVVSTGPAQTRVPNVVGKQSVFALGELAQAGLSPAQVEEPSRTAPASQVLRTDPPAGTSVEKNSVVKVFVSSGPPRR